MATYTFDGYAPTSIQFLGGATAFPEDGSAIGVQFRIDPAFDSATDRYQYEITETGGGDQLSGDPGFDEVGEDPDQFGTVRDADGNVVAGSSSTLIYGEHAYSVLAPDGSTINFYTVEVAGADMGIVSDAPLQPGVTYEIVSQKDIVPGDEPFYNTFADPAYDPSAANAIDGGDLADDLQGGGGSDTIYAGAGDDTISGGDGIDLIAGQDGDDYIDAGADNDIVVAGLGNDTVLGGSGGDMIAGFGGDDSIDGGDGADSIDGDGTNGYRVGFKWSDVPDPDDGGQIDDEDATATGTQTVAGVDVTFTFTGTGKNGGFETSDNYVTGIDAGANTVDANSSWQIGGAHFETAAMELSFSNEVENVAFRINDLDDSADQIEQVTVQAYDLSGNPIPVNVTFGSNLIASDTDGVAGNETGTGTGSQSSSDAEASMLVEIPGPVGQIVVTYKDLDPDNLGGQVNITDVWFTEPALDGDDRIDGGAGDDTITTGGGADTVVMSDGGGSDTVTDFDMGDDDGDGFTNDQIDVSGLTDGSGQPVNAWDVTVSDDGSGNARLSFPDGESIVLQGVSPAQASGAQALNSMGIPCFTSGTTIRTPAGPIPIDDLRVGDLVTTRDNGPQPVRWIGARAVGPADLTTRPKLRPVLIQAGALGNDRPMLVSAHHGLLCADPEDPGGETLIRAIHLSRLPGSRVRVAAGKRRVTYIHLLFDRHEIIFAEGVPSESFYPGKWALAGLAPASRLDLIRLLPGLAVQSTRHAYGETARHIAKFSDLRRSAREAPAPALALTG